MSATNGAGTQDRFMSAEIKDRPGAGTSEAFDAGQYSFFGELSANNGLGAVLDSALEDGLEGGLEDGDLGDGPDDDETFGAIGGGSDGGLGGLDGDGGLAQQQRQLRPGGLNANLDPDLVVDDTEDLSLVSMLVNRTLRREEVEREEEERALAELLASKPLPRAIMRDVDADSPVQQSRQAFARQAQASPIAPAPGSTASRPERTASEFALLDAPLFDPPATASSNSFGSNAFPSITQPSPGLSPYNGLGGSGMNLGSAASGQLQHGISGGSGGGGTPQPRQMLSMQEVEMQQMQRAMAAMGTANSGGLTSVPSSGLQHMGQQQHQLQPPKSGARAGPISIDQLEAQMLQQADANAAAAAAAAASQQQQQAAALHQQRQQAYHGGAAGPTGPPLGAPRPPSAFGSNISMESSYQQQHGAPGQLGQTGAYPMHAADGFLGPMGHPGGPPPTWLESSGGGGAPHTMGAPGFHDGGPPPPLPPPHASSPFGAVPYGGAGSQGGLHGGLQGGLHGPLTPPPPPHHLPGSPIYGAVPPPPPPHDHPGGPSQPPMGGPAGSPYGPVTGGRPPAPPPRSGRSPFPVHGGPHAHPHSASYLSPLQQQQQLQRPHNTPPQAIPYGGQPPGGFAGGQGGPMSPPVHLYGTFQQQGGAGRGPAPPSLAVGSTPPSQRSPYQQDQQERYAPANGARPYQSGGYYEGPPSYAGSSRGGPGSSYGSPHPPVGPQGSEWMSGEEVEHIMRILFYAVNSGTPYEEDYYYQAFVHKHFGGRNARSFTPDRLRDFSAQLRRLDPSASAQFVAVEGLGKIVYGSLRAPRVLMDLTDQAPRSPAPDAATATDVTVAASATAPARRLDQEPFLAARILVEDCLNLLLDVVDIDNTLAGRAARVGPGGGLGHDLPELRRRRAVLLLGITASFRLPPTPHSLPAASTPAGPADASVIAAVAPGDAIFLRIMVLPKGRSLLARTLRLLRPPPLMPHVASAAAAALAASAGSEAAAGGAGGGGSADPIALLWATLRCACRLFGGSLQALDAHAERALVGATVSVAAGARAAVAALESPQELSDSLAAFIGGCRAHAANLGEGADALDSALLPLAQTRLLPPAQTSAPLGVASAAPAPHSEEWLGDVLAALLNRAGQLGLGPLPEDRDGGEKSTAGLEDSLAAEGETMHIDGGSGGTAAVAGTAETSHSPVAISLSGQWRVWFDELLALVAAHLTKLAGFREAAAAAGHSEALAVVGALTCTPLIQAMMPHAVASGQAAQLRTLMAPFLKDLPESPHPSA